MRPDPALSQPQVPHTWAGEPRQVEPRAEAAVLHLGVSADLAAVAAVARDEPRAGGVGRVALDEQRAILDAHPIGLGVRRQRADLDAEAPRLHADEPAGADGDGRRGGVALRPTRPDARAVGGELGQLDLRLGAVHGDAQLRAVAAQRQLGARAGEGDEEPPPLLDLDAPCDRVSGSAGRHRALAYRRSAQQLWSPQAVQAIVTSV